MAEFPQPKFEVGQRVFTADGRTGLVTEVFFAQAVNGYRYLVEGIQQIFEESELQDIPFAVSEPLTFREKLAVDLAIALVENPGLDVRFWVGRELGVPEDVLDEAPAQPAGGTLEAALDFWAARGFFPPGEEPPPPPLVEPPVVPPVVPGEPVADLDAILAEVDLRIAEAIGPVVENGIVARLQLEERLVATIEAEAALTQVRFLDLESRVTDALSELENSLLALEQSAQDSAGVDLGGLLVLLGGFVRDPLGWFLERAEDAITGEIVDGLTR